MNRWRSYRLWVAILALVSLFLQDCGVIDVDFDVYINLILSILILLGIINSPGENKLPLLPNSDGETTEEELVKEVEEIIEEELIEEAEDEPEQEESQKEKRITRNEKYTTYRLEEKTEYHAYEEETKDSSEEKNNAES
ncbi:hypothetical protein ACFFGV_00445 [Pontibacillus salicampi]|uniref:Phage holin n=1 Tax=Pontibacillus salicampi TaxID=1449801 RepID=A0ABV6LI43_9BACI